ncbi:hypothetical protein BAUCODRAFT_34762 [Baudoinia panamericana UAMH 10762]|uniref:Uncharacterized protein n=1 Tax=Baudoinia panamericana (strain UAMH 10762) TaxID=717646 RepID=M2NAZ3_BAUPA|nr:uncharacterized protein BAUCODRAFT_34762 [Baudoinia panamericana UAMH 10762]EMC96000.1 hypothetical protein BAUCODRAFT_34762 [Baudoinia panamericana UAMH 10762]
MKPSEVTMQIACEASLHSSVLELKHERSAHLVDILSKDEDIRRLRFDLHILEDDNDEIRELLAHEEERSDSFERLVSENLVRAETTEAQLQVLEIDLRRREQEIAGLQAEKEALKHSTQDMTAALTEKLALTRELSVLRPELEHLKAQAANTEALMTDKLALQRQITNLQCEVENATREAQRALAKRRNTGVEIAQEQEMEDLRRQLKKEQRARQRAEEAADVTQNDLSVDEFKKELAREKRARQKAEEQLEEAQQNTQAEDVRKDLLREKKAKQKLEDALESLQAEMEKEKKAAARAAKRADANRSTDEQSAELREELAEANKARSHAEKAAQKAAGDFEAQKATLEDKLNQFRIKLRSTKEKLQQMEAELATAKAATATAPTKKAAAAKNPKKRNAAHIDADATTLGTPGDGPKAKRGRQTAGLGDKSTFSITPFLNRTMSAAPESDNEDDAGGASPAARKTDKQPLAAQPASKANAQPKKAPAQRKPKTAPALEMVTEEAEDVHSLGQENANKPAAKETGMKIKTKIADGPTDADGAKKKPKIRKSIHEFATFNAEPEVKKKRKLGGLGKTLFDEEEEAAPQKGLPSRPLFGSKTFGVGALGAKKSGLGSSRMGSTLLTALDGSGFQFSPLKRSRKNLDDTLRG